MEKLLHILPAWLARAFTRADRSLQARILIPTAILFAATLCAMGLLAVRIAHAMNERTTLRSAELFGGAAASGLTRAVDDRGVAAIPEVLAALVQHSPARHGELTSVSVLAPDGTRLFSTLDGLARTRAWAQAPKDATPQRVPGDDANELAVLQPLGGAGHPLFGHWLEVRYSRDADLAAESALAGALLLAAVPSLLLLLAIVWWLIGREATRPLDRLVKAMQRAAGGDPSVRADEGWRDELGLVARSFDATFAALQQSRAELELVHRDRLERADRLASVGELTAKLSHEIKNPLAGLSVSLEMLAHDHPPPDSRGELIAEMRHQVARLIEIMEGLLGFVRAQPARLREIDVNEALRRSMHLVSQGCRSTCRPPQPALAPSLALVHGDAAKLEQVFLNLMLNACQAMKGSGGCFGKLGVQTSMRGTRVIVEISDGGPGIPLEVRPNIFKPFYTTKTSGNGLGLAIAEQIVTDHGGQLTFTCPPSGGTVFTVSLPATGGAA